MEAKSSAPPTTAPKFLFARPVTTSYSVPCTKASPLLIIEARVEASVTAHCDTCDRCVARDDTLPRTLPSRPPQVVVQSVEAVLLEPVSGV